MKISLLISFLATSLHSADLVQFKASSPAKAEEVNRNFFVLDSVKAEKANVDLLTSAVNAKAEAKALDEVSRSLDAKATIATVKSLADRHDSLLKGVKDGQIVTPWVAPIAGLATRHDSLLKGVKDGQSSNSWSGPLANLSARHDSLLTGVRGKADTAVAWKAIRDSSANLRSAVAQSKVTSLPWASITGKPTVWAWDSTQLASWYGSLGGKIIAGMYGTGFNSDPGGLALRLHAASATSSVIDLVTDGLINSWGLDGGIQTNSVTRIDAAGNGAFPRLSVGREVFRPSPGKAPMSIFPDGDYYNEGLEILPSRGNGYNGVFLRANESDVVGTIGLARSINGSFFITFQSLNTMAGTFDASSPFSIDPSGGTHIGSDLFVKGQAIASTISTTDLRVSGNLVTRPTTPWADYVFEPGYQAMPLKEIEAFAKEHGHLPEVPSTAEVEKDGIEIARMNAILLKKVEELTLHAVEQEKKLEAMQAKLQVLEERSIR